MTAAARVPVPVPAPARTALRSAIVVTSNGPLRQAVAQELRACRWSTGEAASAAEMFALLERQPAAMVLVDSWLPDLEVRECIADLQGTLPAIDVLALDGSDVGAAPPRSLFRGELLHALRRAQQGLGERGGDAAMRLQENAVPPPMRSPIDGPVWEHSLTAQEIVRRHSATSTKIGQSRAHARARSEEAASVESRVGEVVTAHVVARNLLQVAALSPAHVREATAASDAEGQTRVTEAGLGNLPAGGPEQPVQQLRSRDSGPAPVQTVEPLPEFVGSDDAMLDVSRRIRLVAHRRTTVLVHGATGTGKELVARALHRLSGRPAGRFVAINCAAIPEALMEAELFGYAKGAFTGAVQSRVGRIEAAAGGTLFLDEVGELPLTLQSKLLRFLESGEIQRVGENDTVLVDARVVAATHRKLGAMAAEGAFRLDLLHRLSVFLIRTPSLESRADEVDRLIGYFLQELSRDEPAKSLSPLARTKLLTHSWPGNVRELKHTLERAWILAGEDSRIDEGCIDFGEALL